jgi:hypothetical protein
MNKMHLKIHTFESTLFFNSHAAGSNATEKAERNDSDTGPSYVLPPTPFFLCHNPVTIAAQSATVCVISSQSAPATVALNSVSFSASAGN